MGAQSKFIIPAFKRRLVLAIIVIAILVYFFWTSSRYPSLGDKALMAGAIELEDPLSFVARFPIEEHYSIWKKIGLSTLNWLDTNRQGMTFGVLFGAVFLTLMRYLQRINFKSSIANSTLGLLVGTPLGVCVNCAAPIAKGMFDGGARAETTLAAMIASPTLNIVVLTMLFSILPFYMAVTKIFLSLVLIILLIPLICRWLPARDLQISSELQRVCELPDWNAAKPSIESWSAAATAFAKNLASDFWYILRLTVPLMILAGFLGALVATLIPIESLGSLKYGFFGLIIVALIGTFLPVPIAFDVVICGALLAAGLPVGYVMCLLFTLGSFSIYSGFIVAQTISWRPAIYLFGVIVALGLLSGLGVHQWHAGKTQSALDLLTSETAVELDNSAQTRAVAQSISALPTPSSVAQTYQVEIESRPFSKMSPAGQNPFTKIEAHNIGIDQAIEFSFRDMWPPFWEGRSLSSGDIDQDGDVDLVIASTRQGLYVYLNDGQGQFSQQLTSPENIKNLHVFNAALVDINNDSWLDLFITTYGQGNFILQNNQGRFENLTPVKNQGQAPLSLSLSFGDVDRDGDLDLALGNWAAGWYRRVPGEESRNRILFNDNGEISGEHFTELPGIPGETLSILLTDFTGDDVLDLLVGNDFEVPDMFYRGNGQGGFTPILRTDNKIEHTTTTTMAFKNNDLDNDLIPEIYAAQIAGRSSGISDRLNMQPIENYCDSVERPADKQICQTNMDIKTWYKSGNNFDPSYAQKCLELSPDYEAECKAMLIKDLAIQGEDPSLCDLIPQDQIIAKTYCQVHFWPIRPLSADDRAVNIKQINGRNVLLKRQANGQLRDRALQTGLEVGGWSWDTKIADFDNDSWADILIVNGTWVPNEVTPSNMFFHNDGTGRFNERAKSFGLEDFYMTAAATLIDLEHDGDLDIIAMPVNGPVQAYINNSQSGNRIGLSFEDHIGNFYGIGHKVTIFYGEHGQQKQEVQLGGGFQSFDKAYLHFGLGQAEAVSSIKIDWVEGGQSDLQGPFSAGSEYVISRR